MGSKDITDLLNDWLKGDPSAGEELLKTVYAELRRLARRHMRRERGSHTLQATALVHEAYIRLSGRKDLSLQNRAQFFGVAATEMRRILVDHARERGAQKRGGHAQKLSLDDALGVASKERDVEVLALDEALESLEALEPQQARIVELRFFGGLTTEEMAEVLDVSVSTVERKWRMGRAFLLDRMGGPSEAAT